MQPDLLAQLKDIHVPLEPLWWPPAPGWWLLCLVVLILISLALRWLRGWLRRQRPIKQARLLYAQLYHNYQAGLLSDYYRVDEPVGVQPYDPRDPLLGR